jgi:hypothetical protein
VHSCTLLFCWPACCSAQKGVTNRGATVHCHTRATGDGEEGNRAEREETERPGLLPPGACPVMACSRVPAYRPGAQRPLWKRQGNNTRPRSRSLPSMDGAPGCYTPKSGAPRVRTPSLYPRTRSRTPFGKSPPAAHGLAGMLGAFPSTNRSRRYHSSTVCSVSPSWTQHSFIPSPRCRYQAMIPCPSAPLRCPWPFAKTCILLPSIEKMCSPDGGCSLFALLCSGGKNA